MGMIDDVLRSQAVVIQYKYRFSILDFKSSSFPKLLDCSRRRYFLYFFYYCFRLFNGEE